MTKFDPEKFDNKYEHYFEEIEQAYSDAYQQLHGGCDSEILRAIDRKVLSESEPLYEGNDDIDERAQSLPGDEESFNAVLDEFTTRIEHELHNLFVFEFEE